MNDDWVSLQFIHSSGRKYEMSISFHTTGTKTCTCLLQTVTQSHRTH